MSYLEYTLKVELTGPAEGMCVRKKYKSVADRVFKAAHMRTASLFMPLHKSLPFSVGGTCD